MTDCKIVARLLEVNPVVVGDHRCREAADEIKRLRAALERIARYNMDWHVDGATNVERLQSCAEAALANAWDEGHSEHQDAHESGRPSGPNPYRRDAGDDRR